MSCPVIPMLDDDELLGIVVALGSAAPLGCALILTSVEDEEELPPKAPEVLCCPLDDPPGCAPLGLVMPEPDELLPGSAAPLGCASIFTSVDDELDPAADGKRLPGRFEPLGIALSMSLELPDAELAPTPDVPSDAPTLTSLLAVEPAGRAPMLASTLVFAL